MVKPSASVKDVISMSHTEIIQKQEIKKKIRRLIKLFTEAEQILKSVEPKKALQIGCYYGSLNGLLLENYFRNSRKMAQMLKTDSIIHLDRLKEQIKK